MANYTLDQVTKYDDLISQISDGGSRERTTLSALLNGSYNNDLNRSYLPNDTVDIASIEANQRLKGSGGNVVIINTGTAAVTGSFSLGLRGFDLSNPNDNDSVAGNQYWNPNTQSPQVNNPGPQVSYFLSNQTFNVPAGGKQVVAIAPFVWNTIPQRCEPNVYLTFGSTIPETVQIQVEVPSTDPRG